MWATIMRDRFGRTNPKAMALRFHAQTGGSTLTAQQPENNIVRVAIQALSASPAARRACTRTASTRRSRSRPSARADRAPHAADPRRRGRRDRHGRPARRLYFIEALTTELEEQARELIERIDEMGGAVAAIEQGFVQQEIEEAAFRWNEQVESGERVIVGVNRFVEDDKEDVELLRIDPDAERRQLERTARVRAERTAEEAEAALAEVRRVAAGPRTCCRRCARRSAPESRSARSRTRCETSSARSTRSTRSKLHHSGTGNFPLRNPPERAARRRCGRQPGEESECG
jgi:methylmalonyl-CoA mutase N-terminal domain/subunit